MPFKPFLTLMRPANIVTAIADILAGVSIAGLLSSGLDQNILGLILSTIGLYGGGIVFNDVFDFEIDKIERPERALPSGQVSLSQATFLGISLFTIGILAAFSVSSYSGIIAITITILCLTYNKFAKHHQLAGPINMGLCRSFNLLLGMSISIPILTTYWYIAVIPLIFIGDITLTSQGEVKGKNQSSLKFALALDYLVIAIFIMLSLSTNYNILFALPFLALWLWMNNSSKIKAIRNNQPKLIQKAVKMGVLSLIPLNAGIAAGFEHWTIGIIVLSLLPISIGLARYFSVT